MGLSAVLNNALSGLTSNQASLEVLSRNVSNSGTPGYHDDGSIDEGDFGKQFDQAVVALRRTLETAGSGMRSLVKVNMLLTRQSDVAEMNRRYAEAFGPAPYPARTTCVVASLPDPRMLLEIECVAAVSAG